MFKLRNCSTLDQSKFPSLYSLFKRSFRILKKFSKTDNTKNLTRTTYQQRRNMLPPQRFHYISRKVQLLFYIYKPLYIVASKNSNFKQEPTYWGIIENKLSTNISTRDGIAVLNMVFVWFLYRGFTVYLSRPHSTIVRKLL